MDLSVDHVLYLIVVYVVMFQNLTQSLKRLAHLESITPIQKKHFLTI